MRILDEDSGKLIDSVMIMLAPSEAQELISKLKSMDATKGDHIHVNDLDFTKQITVLIYTSQNLHLFNEKVRQAVGVSK